MSPVSPARPALTAGALVVVLAAPGLAIRSAAAQPSAEPSAEPPPPPGAAAVPAAPPVQTTVASQTVLPDVLSTARGIAIDARVDLTRFNGDLAPPTMFAMTWHAQYISAMGAGGYVTVPAAYVKENELDGAYLGNAELGGLYVMRRPGIEAYVRGGLAVPQTATGGDETGEVTPVAHLVPRVAHALPSGFDSLWVRFGGGLRVVSGALVLGGMVGFDRPVEDDIDRLSDMFHMSGWLGLSRHRFGGAFGISLLQPLDNREDGFSTTPNMMVVYGTGDAAVGPRTRVYGTAGVSLSDNDAVSVGVGVRVGL